LVLNTSATSNSEEHLKGDSVRSKAEGCVEGVLGTSSSFVTSRETPSQTFLEQQSSSGLKLGYASV